MSGALLALAPAWPLLMGLALAIGGRARRIAMALVPTAAVPALAAAIVAGPGTELAIDWLLLGSLLMVDDVRLVFLAFTATVWLAVSLYQVAYHRSDPRAHRVTCFLLLSMAGSIGLTVAGDVASFYLGFALMTFSAYGVVVHEGGDEARLAGRVYMALAVVGEAALLSGFVLAAVAAGGIELAGVPAAVADGPWLAPTVALLLVGFGIKDGLFGLHVWLPLAHPVAPTPSSAALSGVMIKAGLLGFLVFLPIGEATIEWAGAVLVILGLAGGFGAVLAGVVQSRPKVNLAYSSVSQMGLMTVVVGVAMARPELRELAAAAIALYALHHGLTKSALFLGVGVHERLDPGRRRLLVISVAVLGASLAAAPLTAGSVAKQGLKDAVGEGGWHADPLVWALTLSGLATTVLMSRLVVLLARGGAVGERRPVAWLGGVYASLLAVALAGAWAAPEILPLAPLDARPAGLWTSLWPVLGGLGLAYAASLVAGPRIRRLEQRVPPGDLLAPLLGLGALVVGEASRAGRPLLERATLLFGAARDAWLATEPGTAMEALDARLGRWEVAGASLIVIALALGVALW